MTWNEGDLRDEMAVVARRTEFIGLLDADGPLEPRDVVDALDHSRSTVTRALRELREANLVEKTADGYDTTLPGVMGADAYHQYRTASKAILTSKELLTAIPESRAPPVDALVGADVTLAETEFPVRPLEAVSDRVRNADTVQAYLPTLIDTHLLRVWHRAVVVDAVEGQAIVDPDLLTVLKGQYPQLLAEMAAMDEFSAFAASGPPYGIVLTSTGDTTTVSVVVYGADASIRGTLTNDSVGAVEWARAEFERLEGDAVEVTADLDALSSAVTDGIPDLHPAGLGRRPPERSDGVANVAGHSLPLALEAEGFERLSPEYFDAHGQAAPAVSWRTGFTLAEVRAGHAVDRLDDDGRNLTERLLERLHDGDDHVVLGPPGAGKSTICMQVACEWYDRGYGPVLYRERGGGDHFDSVPLLEAYLRQTDGHALVVVEDAVREQAAAIFGVMQAMDGSASVSFLQDARTHEWQNADAVVVDARRDGYRRTAVDQVTAPDLDERECARFVAHCTDLVDADLDLSGDELFSTVEAGSAAHGGDSGSAGDVLVAQHHLSQRYNPLADADARPPTALDEAVSRTYRALTDADAGFVPDLAVLVTLLDAAGVPIAGEYLSSLAAPDEYAELDNALSRLEGTLLFTPDPPGGRASTVYRTRHETWASRFLEEFLDREATQRARNRFGHCVTRLLALADEPDRRRRIQQHLGGRTPHIHQIEADPGNWADETAARIFQVGRTKPSLAPLFGETTADPIELPAACSAGTTIQQAYWRGEMYRLYGDLERAEREFRTLHDRASSVEIPDGQRLKPATSGWTSHQGTDELDSNERDALRAHWRATSRTKLGRVAETRSELETAAGYHEESLALYRELGDRHGEAYALGTGGIVARRRGELETATEYIEESLARYREIGDRRGEAWALDNRGLVARRNGEVETAVAYYEESLALFREIGGRRGEARALNNLGVAARKRGEVETATEYIEESLAIYREIGNRHGEARALENLGQVALDRGQLEDARSRFATAADRLITTGADGASTVLTRVIDLWERQGDVDAARDWCRRAIEFADRTGREELSDTVRTRRANLPESNRASSSRR